MYHSINPLNFNPVMTGFSDWFDYAVLMLRRNQKFIVAPFHFVYKEQHKSNHEAYVNERTAPAVLNNDSFIVKELSISKEKILHSQYPSREIGLMHIGMLLHTFADTHAHQLFSGYNSWVNDVKITSTTDNRTGADITDATLNKTRELQTKAIDNLKLYANKARERNLTQDGLDELDEIDAYLNEQDGIIPKVGHALAGHVPDQSHISFTMEYPETENGRKLTHNRSNTQCFVDVCKDILNFLLSCQEKTEVLDSTWEDFSERLAKGFLFELPEKNEIPKLIAHWKEVFPEYRYSYSKEDILKVFNANANFLSEDGMQDQLGAEGGMQDQLGANYSDLFYQYNRFADTMLIGLYGDHPRNN